MNMKNITAAIALVTAATIVGCAQLDSGKLATAGASAASAGKGGNKAGAAVAAGAIGVGAANAAMTGGQQAPQSVVGRGRDASDQAATGRGASERGRGDVSGTFGNSGIDLFDDTKPVEVRKQAIRDNRGYMRDNIMSRLLEKAADSKNPKNADYLELVKVAMEKEGEPGKIWVSRASEMAFHYNPNWSVPLEARKLAFSLIPSDLNKDELYSVNSRFCETVDRATQKKSTDDIQFVSWAVANANSAEVLKEIIESRGKGNGYSGGLSEVDYKAAVDRFVKLAKDDELMMELVKHEKDPYLITKVAPKLKSKVEGDYLAVAYAPLSDIQNAVEVLSRLYAADPKKAYDAVFHWWHSNHDFSKDTFNAEDWNKRMAAISDMKLLYDLSVTADYDGSNSGRTASLDVAKELKKAMLRSLSAKVDALPKEKLDKLVAAMIEQSKKLGKEGKTCLVGNYYVGMPVLGFMAPNKTQDVKAMLMGWKMDAEGKHVIVSKMAFDSKNLYKATGLERSEVRLKLPPKLGVPSFDFKMTKINIDRNTSDMNAVSEYFGDYSNSYNISGGDVYYRSDSEAKEVRLLYWKEAGRLDVEML